MAKKSKKSRRGIFILILLFLSVLFFIMGGFNLGFFGRGSQVATNEAVSDSLAESTVSQSQEEDEEGYIIEIDGNTIYLNDQEISLDDLAYHLDGVSVVVFRTANAKQVIYEEVKTLLNDQGILIIEE